MPTFLSQIYYGNGKNIIFLSYYLTKGSSFHIWIGKLVSSLVTRKLVFSHKTGKLDENDLYLKMVALDVLNPI